LANKIKTQDRESGKATLAEEAANKQQKKAKESKRNKRKQKTRIEVDDLDDVSLFSCHGNQEMETDVT
jgi:hypothetical protein